MPSIVPRTESVISMWRKASERERALLGEMHLQYEAEIRRVKNSGEEPQNIAYTIHALVDESVTRMLATHPSAGAVKCRRGCASCCSIFVNITREEADLLVGWCADQGIAIDWEKVQRQAQRNFAQWGEQDAVERRCVFLGPDGACRVYEHRPTSCRKYLVITKAKYCDQARYPGHQVGMLAAAEAEVIASATLGVLENGSLPRMLLRARTEVPPP